MKLRHLILTTMLIAALCVPAFAQGDMSLQVTPETIKIDTTYNGTTVKVEGQAPEGSQIVLRIVGEAGELHMKRKDKALGLLWMNMDSLTFHGVPVLYIVGSSKPLDELGAAGKELKAESMLNTIEIEPDTAARPELIDQLIKLKTKERLYQEEAGEVAMGEVKDGMQSFTATLPIPSRLAPGDYKLASIAVKDGQEVAMTEKDLKVELVSTPLFMAKLAFGHGALYGILATIIALVSGLVIGLIFQSKGEAH
ncbi:TIGR02186 family protein [Oceanidesulfovibrio marinus]|uniref:Transmembrane protein (Alph_Pro_TM) n=1 Tax=Oceanidesulfovibrio marinus TaxID=370038 RepID=A0A6P1ZBS0_9BACT|nr:TIGR02186 family protein [Oceanidesulfovibrio marinus]TVM31527.1 hypothetical protein DQK91_17825 [Oceanidesulfovibrio marinus]